MAITTEESDHLASRGIDSVAPAENQGGFVQTSGQIVSTQIDNWPQEVVDRSPSGKFGGA